MFEISGLLAIREIRIVVDSVSPIPCDDRDLLKNSPVVPAITINSRRHVQALRNASYDLRSYPAAPKNVKIMAKSLFALGHII